MFLLLREWPLAVQLFECCYLQVNKWQIKLFSISRLERHKKLHKITIIPISYITENEKDNYVYWEWRFKDKKFQDAEKIDQ